VSQEIRVVSFIFGLVIKPRLTAKSCLFDKQISDTHIRHRCSADTDTFGRKIRAGRQKCANILELS